MDGAPIANALVDGRAQAAIVEGISALVSGPYVSLSATGFNASRGIPSFAGAVPGFLNSVDLVDRMGELLDLNNYGGASTINDIKVGGSGIEQDKNASATNTPKISIWGNEYSPIHWNLLSSVTGQNVISIANNISDVYEGYCYTHLTIAYNSPIFGFDAWNFYAAFQWYRGWQWIDNDSERIWNNLIGSDLVAEQCYQYSTVICSYGDDCDDVPRRWRNCPRTCEPVTLTRCVQVHSNGISDAFIPYTSQRGDGSPSWRQGGGNPVSTIEAMGVNHQEEVQPSSGEMRSAFAQVFSGDPFFNSSPAFQINRF